MNVSGQSTSNSLIASKQTIELGSSAVNCSGADTVTQTTSNMSDQIYENCRGVFDCEDHLKAHRSSCRAASEPRQCRGCGRAFVRQTALEAHQERCLPSVADRQGPEVPSAQSTRVPCPACTKTFTLERSMRAHFATFHATDPIPRPFACDFCGRAFVRANLLAVHHRTHTGDKPFQCEVCGRRFICRADLNKHHRLHVDGYMYKCRQCGKEIKTSRESADHRRQHSGGIVCPVCGKSFTRYLNMKAHVRGTHGGERRYACGQCGKTFVYAQNLRYHRRTHGAAAPQTTTRRADNSTAIAVDVDGVRGLPLAPAPPLFHSALAVPDERRDIPSSAETS